MKLKYFKKLPKIESTQNLNLISGVVPFDPQKIAIRAAPVSVYRTVHLTFVYHLFAEKRGFFQCASHFRLQWNTRGHLLRYQRLVKSGG